MFVTLLMWSCRPRRITNGLWWKSRSSSIAIRYTSGSRRRRRPRTWKESSSSSSSSASSFHPIFPTVYPAPLPCMVSLRRGFSVSLPEERIEANDEIRSGEETTAADTGNKHCLLEHESEVVDLMSLVEEILSFQDEIGNTKVRHRWIRHYGFLKRQLGLLGHKSNYDDDSGNHSDKGSSVSSTTTTMEFSAIEEGSDNEEQHQLVHIPYFDRSSLEQMDKQLGSMENESIPPESRSSGTRKTPDDHPMEAGEAKASGSRAVQLGEDDLVDDQKEELDSKNDTVTGESTSFSNNLAEREEEDNTVQESNPKDSFARALALLRSMKKAEWNAYDLLDEENDDENDSDNDDDDENEQDEGDYHEPASEDEDASHRSYNDEDRVDDHRIEVTNENRKVQDLEVTDKIASNAVSKTTVNENSNREGDDLSLTEKSNELLIRLALSPNLEAEQILRQIMEEYHRMIQGENFGLEASAPNQITYEILLLTLYRRLGAIGTASDLIEQMMEKEERWAPDTLLVATQILERRRNLVLAMQLLSQSFQDIKRENKIPSVVFHSTLGLAKQDDAKDAALAILEMCMKEAVHRQDRKVDKLVVDGIHWRTRSRRGQKMDTTRFLSDLTDLIEKRRMYIPGTIVWKHLILTASKDAFENEERCELVRRAFQKLLAYRGNSHNWLTRHVFHQAIVVGDTLGDTKLAADVTARFLQQYSKWSSRMSEDNITQSLPVKDIIQAMELCIQLGDNLRARNILRSCTLLLESDLILKEIVESLYLLCLKGYAAKGEPASGLDLLDEMKRNFMRVSEQAYGTVIHGYAIAGNHAEAKNFFTSMETASSTSGGEMTVVPGATCYDGLILSCVRSRSWQETLTVFQQAKEKKLALHASTSHAVIMSASRLDDASQKENVKSIIQDILETDSDINKETCVLALHVLIPELGIQLGTASATSLDDIRQRLRNMAIESTPTKKSSSPSQESALKIISCLRMAELEDERCRLKRKDISSSSSSARPHRAWATALASIVAYLDTQSNGVVDDERSAGVNTG